MAGTDGRKARGDARRARVLEAAVPLATTEGLEGFSLERLASVSGVPKGSIQILFTDKAGLQRSIVLAAQRTVTTNVMLPAAAAAPGLDRLLSFGRQWVDYMVATRDDGGCFFCSVWTELQSRPGALQNLVAEERRRWLDGLAAAVEYSVEQGQLTSVQSAADDALGLLGTGMTINAELQFSRHGSPDTDGDPGERAHAVWVNHVAQLR